MVNYATYTVGGSTDETVEYHDVSRSRVNFDHPNIGGIEINLIDKTFMIIDHVNHDLIFAYKGNRKNMEINDKDPSLITVTSTMRVQFTIHVPVGSRVHVSPLTQTHPKTINGFDDAVTQVT